MRVHFYFGYFPWSIKNLEVHTLRRNLRPGKLSQRDQALDLRACHEDAGIT